MANRLKPYPYHSALKKRMFDLILSTIGFIIFSPLFLVISIMIKLTSKGPIFFIQQRVGKDGKVFKMIMFRTMYEEAERDQVKYRHLNEADGPVFKIRDDPRFVGIGKFLAKTGLDELPQLINVIKDEMSLVGPRPLPAAEAKKLTRTQKVRELIKPGVTSSWVVSGAHNLKFEKWAQLDRDYVAQASLVTDVSILIRTSLLMLKSIGMQVITKFTA